MIYKSDPLFTQYLSSDTRSHMQYFIFFTLPVALSATKRLSLVSKHKPHGDCK